MFTGVLLRLNARAIAWPAGWGSYSGPRENQNSAILEKAISEVSICILCIGGLIFTAALITSQITCSAKKQ